MTYETTRNVTSLPESAFGLTLSGSRDGRTTGLFGQAHVRVSLSASQAKAAGLTTSGTYGRRGTGLSANARKRGASLSRSLANRLRAKTDLLGSTLFNLTWKQRVTPSGRRIFALRASARRTSGKDFTSWPTPQTADDNQSRRTPDSTEREFNRPNRSQNLALTTAMLTTWATPTTQDHKDGSCDLVETIPINSLLGRQCQLTVSGKTQNGFIVATNAGDRYRLNPLFSLWLMGLPPDAWASCGERAMLSTLNRRKRSSKAT